MAPFRHEGWGIGFDPEWEVHDLFSLEEWEVGEDSVVLRGRLLVAPDVAFSILNERFARYGYQLLMQREGELRLVKPGSRALAGPAPKPIVNLLLLVATFLTTLFVGATYQGANPLREPDKLILGLPFSLALLSILGVHELGHYFVSKKYGIRVTLPYFIPVPFGLGTFGAFIKMRSPVVDRRALFDVGVAGPLAGLALAVPALILGLLLSEVVPEGKFGIALGSPLLFSLIMWLTLGPIPEGYDVVLHPVAFAGWIGFFVTALNLLPVGQLDGGHISYALLGRRQEKVALATFVALFVMGILYWQGWLTWSFLVLVLGLKHPPPLNDLTLLDEGRRRLGVMMVILFFALITPNPFSLPHF